MRCKRGFLVLLLAVPLACAAADGPAVCSAVDVRQALGPVRFQDDKSWCFAFAAADLLTYRYREELKGERVSDVYTALTYTHSFALNPYSDAGGFATLAVLAAERRGLCPQSLEDKALHNGPLGSLQEKLQTLRTVKALYDAGDTAAFERKLAELEKTHSAVTAVPRDSLLRVLQHSTKRNFPLHFADLLCGSNRYQPAQSAAVRTLVKWEGKRLMWRAIDEQLSRQNIVAIGYNSSFLVLGDNAPSGDPHMSVLVGRRWNAKAGRCEYLIRNSFGPQCVGYGGAYYLPENCQAGHIWAPRAILEKNIYAVTYLKPAAKK